MKRFIIRLVPFSQTDRRHLAHFVLPCQGNREQAMPLRFWLFVAATGGIAHLILFMADREISAGVDRLAVVELAHPGALDVDPDLKLVSERSPYMRNER
jgi:hypothetical protein